MESEKFYGALNRELSALGSALFRTFCTAMSLPLFFVLLYLLSFIF